MVQSLGYGVKIAKKVCPAVISVIVSKDLPKVEDFYSFPYGGKEYIMPMIQKDGSGVVEKTQIGGGSGFIISSNGYVLTSNHVVADMTAEYTVIVDPEHKYPAKILSRNPINDVAVLKIEGKNFPFIPLANSDHIQMKTAGSGTASCQINALDYSSITKKLTTGKTYIISATDDKNLTVMEEIIDVSIQQLLA